jgi:palmitoyl-protein thioesterase
MFFLLLIILTQAMFIEAKPTLNYPLIFSKNNNKLPVVIMHGLLSNSENMNQLKDFLTNTFNLNVIVIEIGNGAGDSLNMPLDEQGEILCGEIMSKSILKNGFNFIGISQGGILGRYYIQKCNEYKVNNFITLVTPHGGVYNKINTILDVYGKWYQDHVSIGSYWRDPYRYDTYLMVTLLADMNNEIITVNSDMNKKQLSSLNNFIMVYSPIDTVVMPPESGKFSTYKIKSMDVISLEETIMYNNLGLK